MKKSYCFEGDLENNPLMDLLHLLLKCELLAGAGGPSLAVDTEIGCTWQDTAKPLLEVRQKAEHGGAASFVVRHVKL